MESLADPSSFSGLDENDPGSVARWMKKMGKELGEDLGGEDIDQLAEEAAQEAAGGGSPATIRAVLRVMIYRPIRQRLTRLTVFGDVFRTAVTRTQKRVDVPDFFVNRQFI